MTIEYEKQGNVAIITINRPDARNAVSTAVATGIEESIDKMEDDDEVWVGVLTGAKTDKGYIFCAGADLKQMSTDLAQETQKIRGESNRLLQEKGDLEAQASQLESDITRLEKEIERLRNKKREKEEERDGLKD